MMQVDTQHNLSDIQKNIILRYHSDPLSPGILEDTKCCQNLVEELNRSSQKVLDHSFWSSCIKRWKKTVINDYFYTKKMQYNVFSIQDLQLLFQMKDSLDDASDDAAEELIKEKDEVTCWTCLANIDEQETCKLFTIFVEENHILGILLNSLIKVFGDKQDDLSPLVCFQCFKTLKMMHNFRQMCKKNNKILRQNFMEDKSDDGAELKKKDFVEDDNTSVQHDEMFNDENDEVQDSHNESLLETPEIPTKSKISTPSFTETDDTTKVIQPSQSNTSGNPAKTIKVGYVGFKYDILNFSCDKCDKTYENYYSLITHERRHHMNEKGKLIKSNVNQAYVENGNMSCANVRVHQEDPKMQSNGRKACDECEKTFARTHTLNIHKRFIHRKEEIIKPFGCAICGKYFRLKHQLVKHIRIHASERASYMCETCGKIFKTLTNLRVHCNTHRLKPKKSNVNQACEEYGKTLYPKFRDHYKNPKIKSNNRKACDECEKTFARTHTLNIHKRMIHRKEKLPKPFGCAICGNYFRLKQQLVRHIEIHASERAYICETCGKTFKTLTSLRVHVTSHRPKKEFHCKLCSHVTTNSTYLKIHNRIHTGERPYTCEFCSASFTIAGNRLKHIQVVHKKLKPYKCNVCEKTFSTEDMSRRHILNHTGARPYQCPVCMETYAWYLGLKKHMKRLHKGVEIPKERQLVKYFTGKINSL